MKIKLSISIKAIGEEPIQTVKEKPVKSLERWYDAALKETDQVDQLRKDILNGL